MLKNIKDIKEILLVIISGTLGSIITLFMIFLFHVKAWNIEIWNTFFNFFIAVGTIALAAFAWMAYRYATKQYMENEKAKLKFDRKYNLICEINDYIYNFYIDLLKMETAYSSLINNTIEQQSYASIPPESEITMLEKNLFVNCDKRAYIFGNLLFKNSEFMKLLLNNDERETINYTLLVIHQLNKEFIASNHEKRYIPLKVVSLDNGLMLERIKRNIQIIQEYRTSTVEVNTKFIELVQQSKLL